MGLYLISEFFFLSIFYPPFAIVPWFRLPSDRGRFKMPSKTKRFQINLIYSERLGFSGKIYMRTKRKRGLRITNRKPVPGLKKIQTFHRF